MAKQKRYSESDRAPTGSVVQFSPTDGRTEFINDLAYAEFGIVMGNSVYCTGVLFEGFAEIYLVTPSYLIKVSEQELENERY